MTGPRPGRGPLRRGVHEDPPERVRAARPEGPLQGCSRGEDQGCACCDPPPPSLPQPRREASARTRGRRRRPARRAASRAPPLTRRRCPHRAGFTGIDDPYEEPEKPELVIEARAVLPSGRNPAQQRPTPSSLLRLFEARRRRASGRGGEAAASPRARPPALPHLIPPSPCAAAGVEGGRRAAAAGEDGCADRGVS